MRSMLTDHQKKRFLYILIFLLLTVLVSLYLSWNIIFSNCNNESSQSPPCAHFQADHITFVLFNLSNIPMRLTLLHPFNRPRLIRQFAPNHIVGEWQRQDLNSISVFLQSLESYPFTPWLLSKLKIVPSAWHECTTPRLRVAVSSI